MQANLYAREGVLVMSRCFPAHRSGIDTEVVVCDDSRVFKLLRDHTGRPVLEGDAVRYEEVHAVAL